MFPNSKIAKAFSCNERKSAYVVCHGLRPFFLSCLQRELEQSDGYTVLFDESLNDYLQRKQMAIRVRYWSRMPERVTTRFYTSVFMGHSTAEDLQEKLLGALEDLPLARAVQLSMDGPNVNLKCFRGMQEYQQQNHQVQCLDLGTCGLHTIHNAYRAGGVASKWGLENLLSSLSAIFHDAPARREDFSTVTGQVTFPLNFASHRWVENVPVIERAITLCGDVQKTHLENTKKQVMEQTKASKRSHIEEEIESIKTKKRRLEATIADLTACADKYPLRAEATSDITLIVKSNSLRQTANEKSLELADMDESLKGKLLELKS
ncbi:hypothetical protein MRX96_052930 [Rhipicephalus microplus]